MNDMFTRPGAKYLRLFFAIVLFSVSRAVAAPVITSFNPSSGPVGTVVTITGSGFNTNAASNVVFFGATVAHVTTASATSLTVIVPVGATYQPISVLNGATQLIGYADSPFVLTFSGKNAITTQDMAPKVDFATSGSTYNVVISDIDGDGKPDIIVANANVNTISVLRNTSVSGSITAASFATRVDFATGVYPVGLAVGDIDGDGKPDVVVSNQSANTVSVLRNTATSGTIAFATHVDFATGNGPGSVAIADFDGDGKPDLAVSDNYTNSVSVLRNTSVTGTITATSFATHIDFTADNDPYGLTTGDLDGDGKPEIIVDNVTQSSVSVLHNTSSSGTIAFAAKVDFATGAQPENIAIGDLDGDGKPEMVTANNNGSSVSVFHNTSAGGVIDASSFATKVDLTTARGPGWVTIGDIDGDGKPDLAVGINNGGAANTVSVLRNVATTGTISTASFAPTVDFTTGYAPGGVAIADLDGDGRPDMVVGSNTAQTLAVLRNNPLSIPQVQASNLIFTNIAATTATVSWTNGNGASRAVFLSTDPAAAPPALVNAVTYTGDVTLGYGTQIGSWYCVYNGTGTTVNLQGLGTGSTYRVMTVEYNGLPGTELYLTITASGNPANLTTLAPTIATSGTLSALSTTYGTPSATGMFNVSGVRMIDAILVTPPAGYEVSLQPTTGFSDNLTLGAAGTIPVTPVYIRLAAATFAGNYSGDVVLSSLGATDAHVATVASTIAKAPLTITINNTSKGYGTTLGTVAGFTAFTASGLKNAESITSVTVTYSAGYAATDAAGGYSDAAVGSLPIGPRPFSEVNYVITYVSGNLTVTPLALTITATGPSKPYGVALAVATSTSNFTATATLPGETVTGITLNPDAAGLSATTPVGASYSVLPSAATGTGGFLAANYAITYLPFNGIVGKKILTVSATAINKIYDNNTTATVTLTDNRQSGDVLTANYTLATFADKNVGNGKAVTVTGITISGPAAANYDVNTTATTTANITPATATVTALTDTRVYNKTTASAIVPAVTGMLGTDAILTAPVQMFASSTAGTNKVLTPLGLVINDGNGGNNYTTVYVNTLGAITAAPVTVTAQADRKTYDATNTSAVSPAVSGLIGTDMAATTPKQTFDTPNVGSGKTLTPAGLAINDGNSGNNYSITYVPNSTGTITAATLTYNATPVSRNYGLANPSFTGTVTGFIGTDTQASATTGTLSFSTTATSTSPAGSYAITGTGLSALNYTFAQAAANTTAFTIVAVLSNNAALASLGINNGTLSPVFASTTKSYTATVDYSVATIILTPQPADANATIKINGAASNAISLTVGDNTINIVVTAQDGTTQQAYTMLVHRNDALNIPVVANNMITPNGDGNNDTWVVKNILNYPNNMVTVFDREGRTIYTKKGYANDWNGTFQGAVLNEGTYYYAIDLGTGQKAIKGFITIIRDK